MDLKCPHCLISIHLNTTIRDIGTSNADAHKWYANHGTCPSCKNLIIFLMRQDRVDDGGWIPIENNVLIWPKFEARPSASEEVPDVYADDYREACNVIGISPNAAAALCRRCLQAILHNVLGIKKANLFEEIEEAVATHQFPSQISDELDVIRHSGNIAAHPLKSASTGSIVDVEKHEAEWCLEIMADVFDFVFVQPAKRAERKSKLSSKLVDAGKSPMK